MHKAIEPTILYFGTPVALISTLNSDGSPNLASQPTDRLQHTQLPAAVCDRDRERVDDPQNGHENRDRNLDISDAEPLVGQPHDVSPDFTIRQHEQAPLTAECFENASLHVRFRRARGQINAENVHGVIVPIALVQLTIHQDGALLIGIVGNDAGDRQMQDARGTGDIDHVAEFIAAQKREILQLQRELDVAEREAKLRAAAFYADAGVRLRDSAKFDEDTRKEQAEIDSKKQALEAANQKLADLQETARKAGVPPGQLD